MKESPQSTLNLIKVTRDTVPVNLFILCQEMLFMLIKKNKNIKGIKMLENTFLHIGYADDGVLF